MEEASYSVTFVQGKPPMITVRGDTANGWSDHLDSAAQSGALAKIRQINDSLNGVRPDPPAPAAPGPSENWQSTQQSAQQLPAGFAEPPCGVCGLATRHDSNGVSKQSGRPYKRYRCTIDPSHKATFTD
jgi:hypothetical protein